MSGYSRRERWAPQVDLGTVRDTLEYMHGDMRGVRGLEKVAAALEQAMAEIDVLERASKPASLVPIDFARFVPRRG